MMFAYDYDRLNTLLKKILQRNLPEQAWTWLEDAGKTVRANAEPAKFNIAFVSMPRKTGKNPVEITRAEVLEANELRAGFRINDWTTDRLARVWLLMQLNAGDKEKYYTIIENLFLSAEMSELVALYSSLPLLAYPEMWKKRCAEGIRSNIGQVLEAVICNNPYPSEALDEAAWNQLVLKAIFTEKPVLQIAGLRTRANRNLAISLSDYAHERWAAHREVNPLLWTCMSPFINAGNFSDIERLFSSENLREKQAAALVCYECDYKPAKTLLAGNTDIKEEVERGKITWAKIAGEMPVISDR